MQENPFKQPQSPILHLYERSRQKSQQNRAVLRTRSSSFQNFKVKIIRNAIERHHIIQKTQHSEKERQFRRERQLSRYYGIQNLRVGTQVQEFQFKQNREIVKKEMERRRSSDRMSSLLNIKPEFRNWNGQTPMSYYSNYVINQQSSNEIDRSQCRSIQKKVSITSSVDNNHYDEGEYYKKSRFVNEKKKKKIDLIREEYFESNKDVYLTPNRNRIDSWRVI